MQGANKFLVDQRVINPDDISTSHSKYAAFCTSWRVLHDDVPDLEQKQMQKS